MDLTKTLDNHQKDDSKTDVRVSPPVYILTLNQQETPNVKDTNKLSAVLNVIRENLAGSDLLMCLFMAALNSYRVDRCLRPFPIAYTSTGNKNIEKLVSLYHSLKLEKIYIFREPILSKSPRYRVFLKDLMHAQWKK